MAADHWQRIGELIERTLSLQPTERAAFLAQTCGDDTELRAEVELLLQHWATVYDRLHRLARAQLDRQGPACTVQAAFLVKQAYLLLVRNGLVRANGRHFFGAAAGAMRCILLGDAHKYGGDAIVADQQWEALRVGDACKRGCDAVSAGNLWSTIYEELLRLARAQLAREGPSCTLDATSLANEACLRLVGDGHVDWSNRRHFFGAAAEAMRRILVDYARRRRRGPEDGGNQEGGAPVDGPLPLGFGSAEAQGNEDAI